MIFPSSTLTKRIYLAQSKRGDTSDPKIGMATIIAAYSPLNFEGARRMPSYLLEKVLNYHEVKRGEGRQEKIGDCKVQFHATGDCSHAMLGIDSKALHFAPKGAFVDSQFLGCFSAVSFIFVQRLDDDLGFVFSKQRNRWGGAKFLEVLVLASARIRREGGRLEFRFRGKG